MDLDNFGGYFGGSLMTEMRKKKIHDADYFTFL